MIVYAIRHKPTGAFMPARMFRTHGRGWTHWIPEPEGKDHGLQGYDKNPRIFWTRRTANNSLTMWLQGTHELVTVGEDWDAHHEIHVNTPICVRRKKDMEIVSFSLEEIIK